jgi:hypothetical protein
MVAASLFLTPSFSLCNGRFPKEIYVLNVSQIGTAVVLRAQQLTMTTIELLVEGRVNEPMSNA